MATCSDAIRVNDYTKSVPTLTNGEQIEAIQLISDVTGEPTSLVEVVNKSAHNTLDVYAFGCTLRHGSPTLIPLFKQQGLIQGIVEVTQTHTLSIGQLDSSLSIDQTSLLLPMQQNIYHEYRWIHGQFELVTFPALYPVTSRSEAEALQDSAINGEPMPWSDPSATAVQMALDLLHRTTAQVKAILVHKDQTSALVLLKLQQPSMQVNVTLNRLIQQDNKGLWFVTAAQSPGITLDTSRLSKPVSSPLTVHGTFTHTVGKVGLTILDHTLTPLQLFNNPNQPQLPAMTSVTVNANNAYTGSIYYNNSRTNQPGLLLIEAQPPNDSSNPGEMLLTNLILS